MNQAPSGATSAEYAAPNGAWDLECVNPFWMIFQPLRSWLISGVPLGQVQTKFHEGEVRKIILGWTIGANSV